MEILDKVRNAIPFLPKKEEYLTQQEIAASMQTPDIREYNNQSVYGNWEQNDLSGIVGVTLDNSSLLISIETSLLGKVLVVRTDDKGRKVSEWRQIGEPVMNEKGVAAIMRLLRSVLDKNSIMTYIPSEDKLNEIMIEIADALYLLISQNIDEFEIKNNYMNSEAKKIVEQILLTLYRGLHGNEKKGIYKDTQTRRVEQYQIPITDAKGLAAMQGKVFR